jgi:aspartate/methionine/tyrosine aminotransferase
MLTPLYKRLATAKGRSIAEVAAVALSHPDTIKMWYGEADLSTPQFIKQAAERALQEGKTFYSHRRGIEELREAIAAYLSDLYKTQVEPERVTVTASGMNAIIVSLQVVNAQSGNIVIVDPIWPNITTAIKSVGAEVRPVSLRRNSVRWYLDMDELFDAVDNATRAIFVASPGNPTGWVCEEKQQAEILHFCSQRGIHLIADEVYHRIVFDRELAPSCLNAAESTEAPLLIVNSFSKLWAMSGWRIGWLIHPSSAADYVGEINAVNNTCSATFVQYAGIEAIRNGEPFAKQMRDYCRQGRDYANSLLREIPRVHTMLPEAGMYLFFSIDGVADSVAFAKTLAAETGVGFAPGSAFGEGNEGYFRLCYALNTDKIGRALDRLNSFIASSEY